MTINEAIELINQLYMRADFTDEYGDFDDTEPYQEAIDFIADLLKNTKEDLISRKAVLECIGMTSVHSELAKRLRKLPTISKPKTDGDLISRKAVLSKLNKIKNEKVLRNGGLPKIDRAIKCVEELPTIPQTDTKWDKLYMYLNDRRLAYSESVEEHIEDYYKGIYDDLGQIMSVMEDMEKEEPKPIPQTDISLEQAIDRLHELGWLQEHDRILTEYAEKQTDSVLEDIKAEINQTRILHNSSGIGYGLDIALGVIDKHISRKENE